MSSGTEEIYKRTAQRLGLPTQEVKKEILSYWMDVDLMFNWLCGYGVNVEKFGHFIFFTNGLYSHAKDLESKIERLMKLLAYWKKNGYEDKAKDASQRIADYVSRIILLNYSMQLYEIEVLSSYPRKYKIKNIEGHKAIIGRLEKLFGIPISAFPISVSNPVQKVFVQSLQRKGILRHKVVEIVRTPGRKRSKV